MPLTLRESYSTTNFFLVRFEDLFCKSSYSVRKGDNTDQKKLRIRSLFRQCKNAQVIDEETRSEFQKVAVCTFTALVKIEFFIGVFLKILQKFLNHFKRAFWKTQFFHSHKNCFLWLWFFSALLVWNFPETELFRKSKYLFKVTSRDNWTTFRYFYNELQD